MTKREETQNKKVLEKKSETLYTKQQIIKSQKYKKYKDILTTILEENKNYSSKEIDTKIKEFLERKV